MSTSSVDSYFMDDHVLSKVDSTLNLEKKVKKDKALQEQYKTYTNINERCLVCTLPLGTCKHSPQWIESSSLGLEKEDYQTALDKEIDDILDVIGETPTESKIVQDEVNINTAQWVPLDQRLTEKIGSSPVCLFSPDERGWHSSVSLNHKFVLVFGGLKHKKNQIPPPLMDLLTNNIDKDDIECFSDLMVYDVDNLSWHGAGGLSGLEGVFRGSDEEFGLIYGAKSSDGKWVLSDCPPSPRYGHVACALDDNRMLLFGGRSKQGSILGDTWIYHFKENIWMKLVDHHKVINPNQKLLPNEKPETESPVRPKPRFFSAASHAFPSKTTYNYEINPSDIYLFGGTNGEDNFNDMWVFRGTRGVLLWERVVLGGSIPAPRFGHKIVPIPAFHTAVSTTVKCSIGGDKEGGHLVIIGGCLVHPSEELVGEKAKLPQRDGGFIQGFSNDLQHKFAVEHKMSELSKQGNALAIALRKGKDEDPEEIKAIYHRVQNISKVEDSLEHVTRDEASQMLARLTLARQLAAYDIKKSRHSLSTVDVHFFDVGESIFKPQQFPKISGKFPKSRMFFGAASVGKFVFVMGGVDPTTQINNHVEDGEYQTKYFILNLETMRWSQPVPARSKQILQELVRQAEAELIRAKLRCKEEKLRGISYGVLNGLTIELVEARAVVKVCEWRKKHLLLQCAETPAAPKARFGASLITVGQRLYYTGGWEKDRAVPKGETMVLDIEQELERQRREEDAYKALLERQRREDVAEARLNHVLSVYELRMIRLAEQADREREWKDMQYEEVLSRLPPLSRPHPVRLVKANRHTLWVEWDRITLNSNLKPIDPKTVTYMLYMRTNFENLLEADRVHVAKDHTNKNQLISAKALKDRLNRMKKVNNIKRGIKVEDLYSPREFKDDRLLFFDRFCTRFTGEIVKDWKNGEFDVLYDDGKLEEKVPRYRLRRGRALALTQAQILAYNSADFTIFQPLLKDDLSRSQESSMNPCSESKVLNSMLTEKSGLFATNENYTTLESIKIGGGMKSLITKKQRKQENAKKIFNTMRGKEPLGSYNNSKGSSCSNSQATSRTGSPNQSHRQTQLSTTSSAASTQLENGYSPIGASKTSITRNNTGVGKISPLGGRSVGSEGLSEGLNASISPISHGTGLDTFDTLTVKNGPISRRGSRFQTGGNIQRRQSVQNSFGANLGFLRDEVGFLNEIDSLSEVTEDKKSSENVPEPEDNSTEEITVKIGPPWQLVYIGNDNQYECSGLIPEHILTREPNLSVAAIFTLQTVGIDHPIYERSQPSDVMTFYTKTADEMTKLTNNTSESEGKRELMRMNSMDMGFSGDANSNGNVNISKKKRQILQAVVDAGKMEIKLEKFEDFVMGQGLLEDEYL